MEIEKITNLYPAQVKLKNENTLNLRLMDENDTKRIFDFFAGIPRQDKIYLKENVSSMATIDEWAHRINDKRAVTILGEIDNNLCAEATLHQQSAGWSKHVGNIRINVTPEYRGLGIATVLCEKICWIARNINIEKIMAEVILEQEIDIAIFQNLGFEKEAVLKDHVQDIEGRKHDLIILANHTGNLLKEIHSHMLYTDPRFGNEY
ncbi:GNAT family N-acetyltransferase [Elusimicrobiota bacterium]